MEEITFTGPRHVENDCKSFFIDNRNDMIWLSLQIHYNTANTKKMAKQWIPLKSWNSKKINCESFFSSFGTL